jgi:four helix bundle protein
VPANIAEGYRKRGYPKLFSVKMMDADGEGTEAQVWLDMAHDCGYMSDDTHSRLIAAYEEVGRMLGSMIDHPERFAP